jgi:hypothetical protein
METPKHSDICLVTLGISMQCTCKKNQNTKTLECSISDTPYTIDTYQTFTFDNAEEMICENYTLDYDDLDWEHRTTEHVQALAESWLHLLKENILDNVIRDIAITAPASSPREYNFRTDSAPVKFTVDMDALNKYIDDHAEDYQKNKIHSVDGFMYFGDEDDARLDYYLRKVSTVLYRPYEDYFMDQLDAVDSWEYVDARPKGEGCIYNHVHNKKDCIIHN